MEGPVFPGGAVKVADSARPRGLVDEPLRDCGFADAFDHRGEGVAGEPGDEIGLRRVRVDGSRLDLRPGETGFDEERVEPPAEEAVAARVGLQPYEAVDRGLGV